MSEQKNYNYKDTWYCLWQNVIEEGGLRLTPQGYIILSTELSLTFWSIPTPELYLRHLYEFDSRLECPYYILPKMLVVFDERTAVELSLYQGNLDLYFNHS